MELLYLFPEFLGKVAELNYDHMLCHQTPWYTIGELGHRRSMDARIWSIYFFEVCL